MICPECAGEYVAGVEECADCGVALVSPEPEPEPPSWEPMPIQTDGGSVVGLETGCVVLKTGRVMEADMAVQAFEEAGIPHYREEVDSGLINHHRPLAPAVGSGLWWVIRVPETRAEEARSALEGLPFEPQDSTDTGGFGRSEKANIGLKIWAFASLVLIAVVLFFAVLAVLDEFF